MTPNEQTVFNAFNNFNSKQYSTENKADKAMNKVSVLAKSLNESEFLKELIIKSLY